MSRGDFRRDIKSKDLASSHDVATKNLKVVVSEVIVCQLSSLPLSLQS
jgi:hypothetical protein